MEVTIRVETRLGHPVYLGQADHILSGSIGSDPVYKLFESDPDYALDHMR